MGGRRLERAAGGPDELTAVRVPVVGLLGEHAGEYLVDGGRQFRPQQRRRRGELVNVRPQDRLVQALLERRPAGEALVEHAPERVLVGRAEHRVVLDLLRRDVVARAEHRPRDGQPGRPAHVLRDAEVGQVHVIRVPLVAALRDEQVPRLDVPVHEPAAVRGVKRPRGLLKQVHALVRRQPAPVRDQVPQVGAGNVAHRNVKQPVARPEIVNGDDVRMVQRSRDLRFLAESGPEDLVIGQFGGEDLQRDHVTQPWVLRLVDDAHAAPAKHRTQPVASEVRADKRQFGHAFSPSGMAAPSGVEPGWRPCAVLPARLGNG